MAPINDEMFIRQQALNLRLPQSVAVVGCGGVGTWAAYLLAMAGVQNLWLFDFDTISGSNLNRIPFTNEHIGMLKTEAVRDLILKIRPDCNVLCMGKFSEGLVKSIHLSEEVDVVVVTTDSLKSRKEVFDWSQSSGVAYFEAAAEGDYGSATGEPADFATEAEEMPGYASVPVWAGPCIASALIVVSYIAHNTRMYGDNIRLGWNPGGSTQEDSPRFEAQTLYDIVAANVREIIE